MLFMILHVLLVFHVLPAIIRPCRILQWLLTHRETAAHWPRAVSPTMTASDSITEPLPIFKLAHHYLIYDVDAISYIRAKYNISGVLIGGLPQAPQQNVFSGIPVELMPEEARLLVERGVAYLVDDVKAHKQGFLEAGLREEERRAYKESLRRQGAAAAKQTEQRAEERKKAALSKKMGTESWNDIPEDMLIPSSSRAQRKKDRKETNDAAKRPAPGGNGEESLFTPSAEPVSATGSAISRVTSHASAIGLEPYAVTPTTSYPPLTSAPPPPPPKARQTEAPAGRQPGTSEPSHPDVPSSYPLYKHLHEQGYFLAPGLRFGCQYMAYPGDPLRFHSHFLCNGMDWEQGFDLIDLVGGGRLGTGVKKGFLIGGEVKPEKGDGAGKASIDGHGNTGSSVGGVRAFCIEWAGM